jgi:SAM-dependent methyltransferase
MKINFGCGSRVLDGYYNIDAVRDPNAPRDPELVEALRFDGERLVNPLPLADGCADEVMAIHVFEHFYRWTVDALLDEFRRLLSVDGLLVLEMPNLLKCCENIISGRTVGTGKHPNQAGLWGLYGDDRLQDPFMCHRFGYTPQTLRVILEQHGFRGIEEHPTVYHPAGRLHRDMRIIARAA